MVTRAEETKVFAYKTKSLDEFAVALALGAEVVAVDRVSDDRFYTFSLQAEFDIERVCLQLASRTLKIDAYGLCEAMRRAKSIIHSK